MVLLLQAILHSGSASVAVLEDQWSVHSVDGQPAVAMSRMVIVGEQASMPLTPIRLTQVDGGTPESHGAS
jgi:hypothetical protein